MSTNRLVSQKRHISPDSSTSPSIPKKNVKVKDYESHWNQGLKKALADKSLVVEETDSVSVIKDKYPKAKHHYLVVSKYELSGIEALSSEHVDLVRHMISVGETLIQKIKAECCVVAEFQMGFHAIPSMAMLHMHIISWDFESIYMKNKKHWNSFTTTFFRPANEILNELITVGKIKIDKLHYKSLLSSPLKCHKCIEMPINIPKLKKHIKCHAVIGH